MAQDPSPSPSETLEIARILDANLNRALEGLRVIEDTVRFGLDWQSMSAACKQIRHRLAQYAAQMNDLERIHGRDTDGDVGTSNTAPGEYERVDLHHLIRANCERIKQSLRVLEEISKLPGAANVGLAAKVDAIESIRYEFYQFEKRLLTAFENQTRWQDKHLYVLIDGQPDTQSFCGLVDQLIRARVDVIQLRDKQLADRELLDRARHLVERTQGTNSTAIINDRPDVARLSRADGVHVGQSELSVKSCRQIIGPTGHVGVSTHSLEQAQAAEAAGADYLGVGPIFPSQTKSFDATHGTSLAAATVESIAIPWFAIGGIDEGNLDSLLECGVRRVAVSNAITGAKDPYSAATRLKDMLQAHPTANFKP